MPGAFCELRLELGHRPGLVLELRSLVLTGCNDPGGDVGDSDGGVRGVHVLTTGPLGPVGVDPKIVVLDLDLHLVADVRYDVHPGERGVPPCVGIEG